jgi:hypothetical protein
MFCFAKTGFSTHFRLPGVVEQAKADCLPLRTLYMFGLFIELSANFLQNLQIILLLLVKN